MVSDNSANLRNGLNHKIARQEQLLDQIKAERKQLEAALDEYERTTSASHERVREVHEALLSRGGGNLLLRRMEEDAEILRLSQDMARTHREVTEQALIELRRNTESEIESLQKKRDALSWG